MTDTLPLPPGTPITDHQLAVLTAGLNQARTSQRSQGRTTLTYMEAWDIKATLIRVFGFGGFSAEALECEIVRIEDNVPKVEWVNKQKVEKPIERDQFGNIIFGTANFRVTARVRVQLTIHQTGAVYTEWAASSQTGPDLGEVSDFAIKTAESDALKRAAIYLGTQFGLSLYANGSFNDVVGKVFAPGQVWPLGLRQQLEARDAAQQMNAIIEGQRPARPAPQGPPPGSSLTPEKHAETQALIERGLRMRAEQDPVEFAQAAEAASHEPGVPVALDPSLEEGFEEQHADAAP
jgi:hypothetical protein